MSKNEIKPVAWRFKDYLPALADGYAYGYTHDPESPVKDVPLYDQSAIDRLTAELDVLRIEKDRLQEIRQQLETERDAAATEAKRYRLLRDTAGLSVRDVFGCWWISDHGHPETLDEALDIYGANIARRTESAR